MTQPMTRTEALKIAIEALEKYTGEALHKWKLYGEGNLKTPEEKAKYEKTYSRRAAALAYFENAARQKDMPL